MAIHFKKRENEPIKKVKIKMACDCGYVYCGECSCVSTESTKTNTDNTERTNLEAHYSLIVHELKRDGIIS